MAIKEVAYNIKNSGGYDKYYFETSTNVVLDLEQGKSLKQILTEINGRSTANETRIANNFNQNEYQLPIVVGTQLRLTKSNTSKRFFVQLVNALTGTITISTDSGATSKPLRDVSDVAVTSLEKGFVEIVEDTTFFTLRNRGLTESQKQSLVTAIQNKGGTVVNNPQIPDFVNGINSIPSNFRMLTGTTYATYEGDCVVSSLPFKPTTIILTALTNAGSKSIYDGTTSDTYYVLLNNNNANYPTLQSTNSYISNDGFKLRTSSPETTYRWLVYE